MLFRSRIAQKVGEEGVETALAAVAQDDEALLGEAADRAAAADAGPHPVAAFLAADFDPGNRGGATSGALAGVPIAVKDNIATSDFPTTCGSRILEGYQSPFEATAAALLPDQVATMLDVLDARERDVLRMRYGLDRGDPRTLEEVGAHFHLTRERIRQIEARALSKLRHPSADVGARTLLAG